MVVQPKMQCFARLRRELRKVSSFRLLFVTGRQVSAHSRTGHPFGWAVVSGDGLVPVRKKNFVLCVDFVRCGREIKHSGVSIIR